MSSPSADQIARTLMAACKAFSDRVPVDPELIARGKISGARPAYYALAALQLAHHDADLKPFAEKWGLADAILCDVIPVYADWKGQPVSAALIGALAKVAAQ